MLNLCTYSARSAPKINPFKCRQVMAKGCRTFGQDPGSGDLQNLARDLALGRISIEWTTGFFQATTQASTQGGTVMCLGWQTIELCMRPFIVLHALGSNLLEVAAWLESHPPVASVV